MQHIEFKIHNLAYDRMGGGDIKKQIEERTAALDAKRARDEEVMRSGAYTYEAQWNPFPSWLQKIIKEMAAKHNSKARYDDENKVFRFKMQGDRCDYDEAYKEFQEKLKTFEAPESEAEAISKWSADNRISMTSAYEDELGAMNDLELYQRSTAAIPAARTSQQGN